MTSPKQAFDELVRLHKAAVNAWFLYAETDRTPLQLIRHEAAKKADREFEEALARLFDQPARME